MNLTYSSFFRSNDNLAIIQILDFFSPIVDDPYTFGQITVANFLSDVYAMGGKALTGITTDVARRFDEHQASGPRAAGYLRGRGPLQLVFKADVSDRVVALRLEYRIKRLTRAQKKILIQCPESLWEIVGGAKKDFPRYSGDYSVEHNAEIGRKDH